MERDVFNELHAITLDTRYARESTPNTKPITLKSRLLNAVCRWSIWAPFFARHTQSLNIHETVIELPTLPDTLSGMRILFLSDLHLEVTPNALSVLERTVLPEHDIVMLGGDYFDDAKNLCENTLRRVLKRFTKPVYAVLGNHDRTAIIDLLTAQDVTVLCNTSITLTHNNTDFTLTGIDDVSVFNNGLQRAHATAIGRYDTTPFKMILSHSPDFLPIAEKCGYALQLSGHTHGGQYRILNRAIFKETRYNFAMAGKWDYGNMKGFTSTGFGSSRFPVRNIVPEVALLSLRATGQPEKRTASIHTLTNRNIRSIQ